MKKIVMLLLTCLSMSLLSGELVIAAKNAKSDYQIVVPDSTGNEAMDRFLLTAAETLHKSIVRAAGVRIPIVKENQRNKNTPAIFIGDTKALRESGVNPDTLKLWEHGILAKNRNIYLYGRDIKSNPKASHPKDRASFVLGSVKAVTTFLETFVNTRFLLPGADGIAVLPMERITVPDSYSYQKAPQMEYCTARGQDLLFDIANNAFYAPWYGCYGGHSHNVAIPLEKYIKSNPEYFAMIKGKRITHPTRPQYCLSNPAVQKLIYQELLDHLDRGFQIVQLGQSDGFRACECEECAKLYGVKEFGEKLWIMHRKMAEQLLKDRPGKMVCIMAYGPTLEPPQTFKDFPDNVMIELAPFSEELLAQWKKCNVKNGFVVYLYNWGEYQAEGFTPKKSMEFLSAQTKSFREGNVRGVYRCGYGELFGLEGPAYYQWSKQLNDPALDSKKLLAEYCAYAFGPAAKTMEQFYLLLNERLKLTLSDPSGGEWQGKRKSTLWNDPALLDGKHPAMLDNMRLLALRYPPEVLTKLETLLAKAEKENSAKKQMPLIRLEFNYLKHTATAVHAFHQYRRTKSAADFKTLAAAIDARNQLIADIPRQANTNPPRAAIQNGIRLFGYFEIAMIQDGGRLTAPLFAPFNWDVRWMQENQIVPAGRTIQTDGKPQFLIQKDFYPQKPEIKQKPVSVQCRMDDQNLYVTFRFGNTTQQAISNDMIQVIIGSGGKRWWFTGRARNGRTGYYERILTSLENKGSGDKYQGIPGKYATITVPAPNTADTSAMIAIPWSLIGGKPEKNAAWEFNAICGNPKVDYIWEYNLYQKTWRNLMDAAGTIRFE